jgi:hypothetical protein
LIKFIISESGFGEMRDFFRASRVSFDKTSPINQHRMPDYWK